MSENFLNFYKKISSYYLNINSKVVNSKLKHIDIFLNTYCVAIENLINSKNIKIDIVNGVSVYSNVFTDIQKKIIKSFLKKFSPWRKGPFFIHGIYIDAEWKSDIKWNRVFPHVDLAGKKILDVGCNNGYYMWRMIGAGAKMVIGIDSNILYFFQFYIINKLIGINYQIDFIPVKIENLPPTYFFDIVFSMGVLYHCKSPIDHLISLKKQIRHGGKLILETIVINNENSELLSPEKSYAGMHIYFIPTIKVIRQWMEKCGFKNVEIINISHTSTTEQRRTDWMNLKSLKEFLSKSERLTIEGYPAPTRLIVMSDSI